MKKTNIFLKTTSAALIAAMLLSGCGSKAVINETTAETTLASEGIKSSEKETEAETEAKTEDKKVLAGTTTSTQDLVTGIKDKYAANEQFDYADEVLEITREEALNFEINCDVDKLSKELESWKEVIKVCQDPELQYDVSTGYNWDKESKKLEITPWRTPDFGISNMDMPDDEPGNAVGSFHLFDKGEMKDWGNRGKMYVVQYYDLDTGKPLDKPCITVVKVKGELEGTINLKYSQTEDGTLKFTWNKIDGADKYFVVSIENSDEYGMTGNCTVVAETTDTSWQPEPDSNDVMNREFRSFSISVDDWYDLNGEIDENNVDKEIYPDAEPGKPIAPVTMPKVYGVIAVSEDGTSMVSNLYDNKDIAPMLPYTVALRFSHDESSPYAQGILTVPSHRWVILCDGSLVQKLVNYDIEKAEEKNEPWIEYEKEDMSDAHTVNMDVLYLPYTISGTSFKGTMKITEYDKDEVKAQLEELKKRQESLRNKSGSVDEAEISEQDTEDETDTESKREPESEVFIPEDIKTTANCALSEYLASNIVAGTKIIDLSDFKESRDQEFLVDAFAEAMYQNPLSLGISDIKLSNDGKKILVIYEDESDIRIRKQAEIIDETDKIVKDIIKSDMSDIEKEMAINEYLCSTSEYDEAALENAEKNDFKTVDKEYEDSFTAYGILVKNTGVCSGYAAAFKLLADKAGLNSIVVTGYIDGNLPHAWNRVEIDGEWLTIDPTNNDNDELKNALFNIPDYASSKTLVEDKRFAIDTQIKKYAASTDDKEYYRMEDKYFPVKEIAAQLRSALASDGKVALRTEYDINDNIFYEIVTEVMGEMRDSSLAGYYWMGVIYMTTDKPEMYETYIEEMTEEETTEEETIEEETIEEETTKEEMTKEETTEKETTKEETTIEETTGSTELSASISDIKEGMSEKDLLKIIKKEKYTRQKKEDAVYYIIDADSQIIITVEDGVVANIKEK